MADTTTEHSVFLDTSKRRKWYFRILAVSGIVFLLCATALFTFGLSFSVARNKPITYADAILRYHYYYSAANDKKIALTFDDGPNPPASQEIMDALQNSNTPATFFYIGRSTLIRPDIAKEASDRGFDVEDHSFTHAQSSDGSYGRMALELNSTSYLLSQISDKDIKIYRPPYLLGIGIDPTINPYIPVPQDMQWALQLGYLPVGSDIDTKDWLAADPGGVVDGLKRALVTVPNGHIVLFHDDPNTAKALPDAIAYLRSRGYQIVPLKELLTPPTDIALATTLVPGDTDANTGGDVSKLQWFLYQHKFLDPYALSGAYDAQTTKAVIAFQSANHLVSSGNDAIAGVAGPATRALMEKISLADNPPPATPGPLTNSQRLAADGKGFLRAAILGAYVRLFPLLRDALAFMIMVTLLLVVARTLGLLSLLLLRSLRERDQPEMPEANRAGASILIPAYNEQENIAATVESVITATYRPREIIVIDDGSKDNTAAEVEAVIRAHPEECIRLITTENGGKARALNTGVEAAGYEIVVVLDADAVLDKEAVAHFMPHFNDPLMGAVAGKVRTTATNGFLDMFQTLEYAIGQNIDKTAFSAIGAIGVVPGPAGAWRKSCIIDAGGFHTDTLVEDQEMTLSMLHSGRRVAYEPRAIAYTETPHNVENFLKQRFRWVYGTMQCFWKHKSIMVEQPDGVMSLVVMPNIFVYNILLPLTYPFADSAFVFGLIFGEWQTLIFPFIIFTVVDLLYANWGLRGEPHKWRLMAVVPLQRLVYRQLLYYTVYKGLVRAIEGTGSGWNKFKKMGATRQYFLSAMGGVEAVLGIEPAAAVAEQPMVAETPEPTMGGFVALQSVWTSTQTLPEVSQERHPSISQSSLSPANLTQHYES